LIPDDDTRLASKSAVIADTTKLPSWLLDASGMVEMAALKGNRYAVADLQALTGASATKLQAMVAQLAFLTGTLAKNPLTDVDTLAAVRPAMALLDQLADGERIFGLQEVADAGVAETVEVWTSPPPYRVSQQACRFFGFRSGGDN
jgi:hypothetical protein